MHMKSLGGLKAWVPLFFIQNFWGFSSLKELAVTTKYSLLSHIHGYDDYGSYRVELIYIACTVIIMFWTFYFLVCMSIW